MRLVITLNRAPGVTDVDSAAVALAIEWLRQAAVKNIPIELTNLPVVLRNLANLYGVANLLQLAAE
jgi:ABC-type transporter Mla MlaB component